MREFQLKMGLRPVTSTVIMSGSANRASSGAHLALLTGVAVAQTLSLMVAMGWVTSMIADHIGWLETVFGGQS